MRFPIRSIFIGVFFYLLLFYSFELFKFGVDLGWLGLSGLTTVISFTLVYFIVTGNILKKMLFAFVAILIAFIISFIYSNIEYMYASGRCNDAIYGVGKKDIEVDLTEKNGFMKSWNSIERCANNLLPFPWGKEAVVID